MTPDGLITSEFDDAAIIEVSARHGLSADLLDDLGDGAIDLELVVLDLRAAAHGLEPLEEVEEVVDVLRENGVAVVLVSEVSRAELDTALEELDWHDLADSTLTATEAGRGFPFPDLPLTALLRTGASSVEGMVVVAATAEAVASGISAGAGLVVGVPNAEDDEQALLDAGADAVVPSVAALPGLLGLERGAGASSRPDLR